MPAFLRAPFCLLLYNTLIGIEIYYYDLLMINAQLVRMEAAAPDSNKHEIVE